MNESRIWEAASTSRVPSDRTNDCEETSVEVEPN